MSAQDQFGYSIPDFLSGPEWNDMSYGNDTMAHVEWHQDLVDDDQGTRELWVWVDYPNPEMREAGPTAAPFVIAVYNKEGDSFFWREAQSEQEVAQLVNMILHLYKMKPAFTFRTDAVLFQYQEGDRFYPGPIVPAYQSKLMDRIMMNIKQAFGSEGYLNVHQSNVSLYDLEHLMLGR